MTTSCSTVEIELYAARFRRNLNGLRKSLNNPRKALQRIVIKSRSGKPELVLISASLYEANVSYLKERQWLLGEP
jgi:hypothetical protein